LYPYVLTYFIAGSLYLLIPFPYFAHLTTAIPSGNHQIVPCIYELVCLSCLFFFFRFLKYVKSQGICLALSDLTTLSIIPSRVIPIVTNNKISLLPMARQYSIIHTYHVLPIHKSINGYLGCFCSLTTVNNTTVNTEAHTSYFFQISIFAFFE